MNNIFNILPPALDSIPSSENSIFSEVPYIQHIPEDVEEAQYNFIKMCVDQGVLSEKFLHQKVHRGGIVGRILDDSGNSDLYKMWWRFMCIDEEYREWTQPHYAYYSSEYKTVCINSTHPILIQYFRDKKIDKIIE